MKIMKSKQAKKVNNYILIIITIIITMISIFNIKKMNILPTKYFIPIILLEIILDILIIFLLKSKKNICLILAIIILLIANTGNIIVNNYTVKTNKFIEKTFKEYLTISTDYVLITSNENSLNTKDELPKKQNIYYFKYSRNIELAKKKLGSYNYISTDSISHVLSDINNNKVVYLLISKADIDYLIESSIEYKREDYKIIESFKVDFKQKINNEVKDNYTIYLNGTDFSGVMRDINLIVTINTKTKKILITSVLRGYYIDVPAYNMKDTLMCLGAYDSNVSKEAIEKLFDIKIDYIVNVNTNSLVDIVNTLGGVEFCSDYSFTTTHVLTDNTYNDKTGKKLNVIKGCKEYNGVEILTIARERLNLKNNERGRIENCEKILINIAKKTASQNTLLNFDEVLNSYSKLYTTDMNKNVITNLLKTLIDNYGEYEISVQNPDGTDGKAIGHLGTQEVGVTFPNNEQVKAASIKIKETLGE